MMGQEMRWVPLGELASIQLPPADDELVRLLIEGGAARRGSLRLA
jgi:hypothetical protein